MERMMRDAIDKVTSKVDTMAKGISDQTAVAVLTSQVKTLAAEVKAANEKAIVTERRLRDEFTGREERRAALTDAGLADVRVMIASQAEKQKADLAVQKTALDGMAVRVDCLAGQVGAGLSQIVESVRVCLHFPSFSFYVTSAPQGH
jgi:hypothetical protein